MATLQEALQQALKDSNVELRSTERKDELDDIRPIPILNRKPLRNTPEWYEFRIWAIDNRINRVATLGLNPHPNLLENRQLLQSQLEQIKNQPHVQGAEQAND